MTEIGKWSRAIVTMAAIVLVISHSVGVFVGLSFLGVSGLFPSDTGDVLNEFSVSRNTIKVSAIAHVITGLVLVTGALGLLRMRRRAWTLVLWYMPLWLAFYVLYWTSSGEPVRQTVLGIAIDALVWLVLLGRWTSQHKGANQAL